MPPRLTARSRAAKRRARCCSSREAFVQAAGLGPRARRYAPDQFMGALGGFMLGGLLGGLLFGGLGHGFGGVGLLDLLLIGGGIALLIGFMRRRAQSPEPAYAGASSGRSTYGATVEVPAAVSDLDRGVDHIRQMDANFDPKSFATTARSMFLAVQEAITRPQPGR